MASPRIAFTARPCTYEGSHGGISEASQQKARPEGSMLGLWQGSIKQPGLLHRQSSRSESCGTSQQFIT